MAFPFKYIHKLKGQRVLVIGGTSGVGYAVAEAALEYGAHIIIGGSNDAKVTRILDRLRDTPGGKADGAVVSGKACNLGNTATIESNLDALLRFATSDGADKLDHVVFTAGDALNLVTLADIMPEDITQATVVRFIAPIMLAKLLPRYIRQSYESSLTLTGGTNSAKPSPGWAVTAGVGAGVEGVMRGLAVDLKPVRVNLVSLGAVHTELFNSLPRDNLDAILEKYRKSTLTNTVGRPQDVAEAYLYCMRDYLIDGTIVSTDGGRLLV